MDTAPALDDIGACAFENGQRPTQIRPVRRRQYESGMPACLVTAFQNFLMS